MVNATVQQIGDVAAKAGVALYGVQEERADLEQLFFRLTSGQFAAPPQVAYGQLPAVPPPGYGQPPPGYGVPPGYPPSGYGQPHQGYAVPAGPPTTPPAGWGPPTGPQPQQGYPQQPGQWGGNA